MSADGSGYASAGLQYIKTLSLKSIGSTMPPGYFFFIGLFSLAGFGPEMSARLVSVVMGVALIPVLFFLTRSLFGRMAALCTVLLYVNLPFMHSMSGIDISEPTYTFFAVSGVWLVWSAWRREQPAIRAGLGGLSIGVAYLTRPEGAPLMCALFALLLATGLLNRFAVRRLALLLGSMASGFLIMAIPYVIGLHGLTGKWQMSGKINVNTLFIRDRQGEAGAYESRFRLDSKGAYTGSGEDTPVKLMLRQPEVFWNNVRQNLQAFPSAFKATFPAFLWIGFAAGLLIYPWRRETLLDRLLIPASCASLVAYMVFMLDPRYLYPYVPLLLVVCGGGFQRLGELAEPLVKSRYAALAVVAVISAFYLYENVPRQQPPYHFTQDGGRYDDKQVGLRLKSLLPADAVLMTRSSRIPFYAEKRSVIPPEADLQSSLEFARRNGVTHIIANMQLYNMRPAFEPLFVPLKIAGAISAVPGVNLVFAGQEPGGQPYLVYQLR
jgi:4-amino-4-deoxy-L-arabinose transferase-like glycosyltransferase